MDLQLSLQKSVRCKFTTIAKSDTVSRANRILILGGPGSGKTSLAKQLSRIQSRVHIEVDELYWSGKKGGALQPNFESRFRRAIEAERWVLEGHYGKTKSFLKTATEQPDLILVLEVAELARVWRLLKRDIAEFARGVRWTSDTWWYIANRRGLRTLSKHELSREWQVPVQVIQN